MPAIIQTPEGILLYLWEWSADSQRAKDRYRCVLHRSAAEDVKCTEESHHKF